MSPGLAGAVPVLAYGKFCSPGEDKDNWVPDSWERVLALFFPLQTRAKGFEVPLWSHSPGPEGGPVNQTPGGLNQSSQALCLWNLTSGGLKPGEGVWGWDGAGREKKRMTQTPSPRHSSF